MEENRLNNSSTDWLDLARLIATFAVITIHVSAPYIYKFGLISNLNWNIYNAFDSLTRFAVPFFVMISGALLLDKKIPLGDFLKKRFVRILIPFVFWSMVYTIYHYALLNNQLGFDFFPFLLNSFLNGASYHLWYIYMIIGLYLAIPILSKWLINEGSDLVKYYLLLWIFSLCVAFFRINLNKDFDFTVFSGYLGYLVLGYFIAKSEIEIKSIWLLQIIVISAGITFYMTYIKTANDGYFNDKFYKYLSVNVAVLSASLFLFLKNINTIPSSIIDKVKHLNKYGFGIYLIHVLVLDAFQIWGINGSVVNPLVGMLLTVLLCYSVSFIVIYILSKNNIIAKLIN